MFDGISKGLKSLIKWHKSLGFVKSKISSSLDEKKIQPKHIPYLTLKVSSKCGYPNLMRWI
jgi:hypothetical protein